MVKVHKPPFILGAVLLLIGLLWALNQWSFRAGAVLAEGLVVDMVVETDRRGTESHYPVVEFTGPGGERFRFQEGMAVSGGPFFDKDEHVPVLYLPEDPSTAQIDAFSSSWLAPLLFSSFGLLLMWVGRIIGRQKSDRSFADRISRPPGVHGIGSRDQTADRVPQRPASIGSPSPCVAALFHGYTAPPDPPSGNDP